MCTEFPTQFCFKPRLFENEHNLLSKASSRLYILHVCKYFGYPKQQLTKLFDLSLLIMSLFYMNWALGSGISRPWSHWLWRTNHNTIGTSVIQCYVNKWPSSTTINLYVIAGVFRNQDCKPWNTITDTPSYPIYQLLSPKKQSFAKQRTWFYFSCC